MVILQNISYILPTKDVLFKQINLSVNRHDKVALIGNNGSGKSTLLQLIAGTLTPATGERSVPKELLYIPQIFGQYNHLTVAQALRIEDKLQALQEILAGTVTEANLTVLNDDWTIEERCTEAFSYWQLHELNLNQSMRTLSGGQKTKVFLAGIQIHQPELILLDEPSNHLDTAGRQLLYEFIQSTSATLLVVSHDRKLLNLLPVVCELTNRGISVYGGNYEFFKDQKQLETQALLQDIKSREKALRKAKEKERETLERQQKLDARGKKKQEKAGLPTISMNTLKNKAENSTARLKGVHVEKIDGISQELQGLRRELPGIDQMKVDFDHSRLHKGKILCRATEVNVRYGDAFLWTENQSFELRSGERIALKGPNGSGKTTLINLILGTQEPTIGTVTRAYTRTVTVDQEYSLINNHLTVYEQAQQFNTKALQEHDVKIRLTRFLFTREHWNKPCSALSGGEKMRLILCCLTITNESPDLLILDEPTNNLDIQNIEILTEAVLEYQGTLIVVSHDESFLEEINIEQTIQL